MTSHIFSDVQQQLSDVTESFQALSKLEDPHVSIELEDETILIAHHKDRIYLNLKWLLNYVENLH